MKRQLIKLTLLILLTSCTTDKRIEKYGRLIDDCDKITIYKLTDNSDNLIKEIGDKDELKNLKDILKRNVKPELQKKFKADKRFDIIKHDKVIGQILINDTGDEPFANFVTDDFGFGFRLTYGIGMYFN
jgi:hypothetical protein